MPVGASESIFAPLAPALGLSLITPTGFLNAISEGTDPTAADKATIDQQIARQPDQGLGLQQPERDARRAALDRRGAKRRHPVATITETLTPAGGELPGLAVAQLKGSQAALAKATGS